MRYKGYWFVNGHLHKFVRRLPDDVVETYDFIDHKYKQYYRTVWDSTKKRAWSISELAEILDRSIHTLRDWQKQPSKRLPRGQIAYRLADGRPRFEFWDSDGVWECWNYVQTIHIGRPRKDGLTNARGLTRAELRAKLNEETLVYVRKGGELVPVWKELI